MLSWEPEKRCSAREMLESPFLQMEDDYNYRLDEKEYRDFILNRKLRDSLSQSENERGKNIDSDSSIKEFADLEDNSDGHWIDLEEREQQENSPKAKTDKTAECSAGLDLQAKYGDNSHLLMNDHGPNPQFAGVHVTG